MARIIRAMLARLSALICLSVLAVSHTAHGQGTVRYQTEPTDGLHLPSVGLAGQHDATITAVNPAGVGLLEGPHLALALDLAREEGAVRSGPGGGIYFASAFGGRLLPKIGWGVALEWLRPNRAVLSPDPGTPTRFTQSTAVSLGSNGALGLAWHHFFDGGSLDGLDTFDLGWSSRFGAHWAAGFVARDLGAPKVADSPVQRRYELEVVSRPIGTDRLELGIGGRIGESDVDFSDGSDVDGWFKGSLRVMRGVYLRTEIGTQSLHMVTTAASGNESAEFLRDYRASAGLEISFGGLGTSVYGTGVRNTEGEYEATGGTLVARMSPVHVPSVFPADKRIERLELKGGIGQRRFTSMAASLRRMADDDDVVGLFIQIDSATAGWATLHELRNEILNVKAAGKKVFAFMVAGSTREYFIASAADKIYVDPAGGIRLQGFAGTSMYFKGLFEKIGVTAEFERIEEYKSAPESWTRTGPTEPAFRMRNELFDSMYDTIVGDIAKSRGTSEARVRTLIDNGPYSAGDLEKLPDLVDKVVVPDDLTDLIAAEMGRHYPFGSGAKERASRWGNRKVAVIYLVGDIVGGKSSTVPVLNRRLVGGETIAAAIAAARVDPSIEAIVLRINSPGGSALASEIMAREVMKTRGVKPIICSMADMAASGGYFAAAGCDRIFADEMTITGSIGIFNGKFDLSRLLARIGLAWTTYKRGQNSDLNSMYRPMTKAERAHMKRQLHYFYGRFIQIVAEGRGMTTEEVNEVGRGHVWTGKQGLGINLVDEAGGLIDAIAYAKKQAGFSVDEKATLIMLPTSKRSLLSQVIGSPLGFEAGNSSAMKSLGPLVSLLGLLPGTAGSKLIDAIPGSVWIEPGVPQARLPFAIVWD